MAQYACSSGKMHACPGTPSWGPLANVLYRARIHIFFCNTMLRWHMRAVSNLSKLSWSSKLLQYFTQYKLRWLACHCLHFDACLASHTFELKHWPWWGRKACTGIARDWPPATSSWSQTLLYSTALLCNKSSWDRPIRIGRFYWIEKLQVSAPYAPERLTLRKTGPLTVSVSDTSGTSRAASDDFCRLPALS